MERTPHESAREFRRAHRLWLCAPGIIASLLIIAYFAAVLDLGSDGWRTLGYGILVQAIAMSFLGQAMQRRSERDIVHALERHAAGELTHEETLRAYVAARSLPQRAMRTQIWSFASSAALCTVAMKLAVPDSLAFTLIVIGVGALTGGAACLPFSLWAMQRFVAPTRDWFAQRLSPSERSALAPPASLAAKLALPVVATATATVAFLALLGYSVAANTLEAHDVRVKARFLESVVAEARVDPVAIAGLSALARARGVASQLAVLSLDAKSPLPPDLDLTPRELA
jgi:hypothetical protein